MERPFAPRIDRVVGRQDEVEAIRQALADPTGCSHILYFVGGGGIGKTRLLEEAGRLANERRPAALDGGILDFFHSDLRSTAGIEGALLKGLDPDQQHFESFREARRRFEERRLAGVLPETLEPEQRELRQAFLDDYNRLAKQRRVLLRFDTTELLVYEHDAVQEACCIEREATEARTWLLEMLPHLENSVILLAGRPPAPLREELRDRCQADGPQFRDFDLQGLSPEESLAYFAEMARLEPRLEQVPEADRRRIWRYTQGRPIRLSLTIDLVLHGREISDLFPPSEDETLLEETIDERLVGELARLPSPVREMLHYLILARKGLDAGLLHELVPDWSEEQCQENLERMRRFTFVKPRPGTDLFFLHDEMYELADRYLLLPREDREYTHRALAQIYRQRLEQAQDLETQRTLKVNRLYYELLLDPWKAFWGSYVRWDEEAVRAYDMELDVRLRGELLRFLGDPVQAKWIASSLPREEVERDAAVRWVRRFISRGQHQRAVAVACCARESTLPALRADDPLYRAALDVTEAEAKLYTGVEEAQVKEMLGRAVSTLEGLNIPEQDPRAWWRTRLLGRAYNNLGYLHWQAGRNGVAVREFQRALQHFRGAQIRDEKAETLNNLGFVYARWGEIDLAETVLQEAIEERMELRQKYALGLSYNTLGLTYVYDDVPLRGGQWCRKALDIFESLGQMRGIGLACLGLGFALRKQADQWKVGTYSLEEADRLFAEAVTFLKGGTLKGKDGKAETVLGAEPVFRDRVPEPLRMWETYNELGSTYCDWGWLLKQQGKENQAQEKYKEAVAYLLKGVEIAERHEFRLQLVDSYEDLAQVYGNWGYEDKEREWLDRVEKSLKEFAQEYDPIPGGLRQVVDPVEEWWLAWGKLHLGYGVRKLKREVETASSSEGQEIALQEAIEEYCKAFACFKQYSPPDTRTRRLTTTTQSLLRRLKALDKVYLKLVQTQIATFAEEYRVDMRYLLQILENVGIASQEE